VSVPVSGPDYSPEELRLLALVRRVYALPASVPIDMGDTLGDLGDGMIYADDHARMRDAFKAAYGIELAAEQCYRKTAIWELWRVIEGASEDT